MSTDLEHHLRQDLRLSADAHPVRLDSDDVLTAGRRHVRRRGQRRAAAGLSLAVALGAGGYGISRMTGTPSPAPATSSPAPRATGTSMATLPFAGRLGDAGFTELRVEADRADIGSHRPPGTGRPSLRFIPLRDGRPALPGLEMGPSLSTIDQTGAVAIYGGSSAPEDVMGAVDAPDATFVDVLVTWPTPGPAGASQRGVHVVTRPVGDSGLTAFAARLDASRADTSGARPTGFVWGTPDGRVHGSTGTRRVAMLSTTVPTPGGEQVVYVSDELDLLGLRVPTGQVWARPGDRPGRPPVLSGSVDDREFFVVLLPAGARDVVATPAQGRAAPSVTTRTLSDGRVVVSAIVPGAAAGGGSPVVERLTWRDPAGSHFLDPRGSR